jgi:hypothetical protein
MPLLNGRITAVETPIFMHSATILALNLGLRLFLRLRGETLSSSVPTTPLLLHENQSIVRLNPNNMTLS